MYEGFKNIEDSRMKRTLFIDYDDTLHDTESKYISKLDGIMGMDGSTLWDMLLNRIHKEIHERHPEKHGDTGFHVELLLKNLGCKIESKIVKRFEVALEEAEEACWENPSYFPDAFEFLRRVKDSGYILCITTGPNSMEKAGALESRIQVKMFDYVFGEDVLGFLKSDLNYYKRALKLAGANPSLTATIGDTISTDVIPAKKLGLKAVWVNRKGVTVNSLQTNPDGEVRDLNEAFEFLQTIFNKI